MSRDSSSWIPEANATMFSIGEFSKVTGLTVKTLRFYHEQGVLLPSQVDPETGYRYYAESKIETARVIRQLRGLGFSLMEVSEMLGRYDDEADILAYFGAAARIRSRKSCGKPARFAVLWFKSSPKKGKHEPP